MGDESTVVVFIDLLNKEIHDITRSEWDYLIYGPVSLHSMTKIFCYLDALSLRRLGQYDVPNIKKQVWKDIKKGKYDKEFQDAKNYRMTSDEVTTYDNFYGGITNE